MVSDVASSPLSFPSKHNEKLSGTPFVVKTFQLINDPANHDVVIWTDNGETFTLLKPVEFSTEILPKYFKHNNLCSFIRQLNTYGFNKQDSKQWQFKHDLFHRDHPELLKNINRRKSKKRDSEKEDVDIEIISDRLVPAKDCENPAVEFEGQNGLANYQQQQTGFSMNSMQSLDDFSSPIEAFNQTGLVYKTEVEAENLFLAEQVKRLTEKQNQMQDAIIKILSELVDTKKEQKSLERKVTLLSDEIIRLQLNQTTPHESKGNVLEDLQASFSEMAKFNHSPISPAPVNPSYQQNPTEFVGDESWAILAKELGIDGTPNIGSGFTPLQS